MRRPLIFAGLTHSGVRSCIARGSIVCLACVLSILVVFPYKKKITVADMRPFCDQTTFSRPRDDQQITIEKIRQPIGYMRLFGRCCGGGKPGLNNPEMFD